MRRLVEAPLKDFSKDLDNRAKFLMESNITATEHQEQADIIVSGSHCQWVQILGSHLPKTEGFGLNWLTSSQATCKQL